MKRGQTAVADDFPKLGWGFTEYGKQLKSWPKGPDGEPEKPAFLTHCGSVDMEDEMLANLLEAYGIPCLRRYPENGSFGRVVLGMSGNGADVYVPESMLEDAKNLISEDGEYDNDERL